jgi:hypothetical protein
MAVSLVTLCVLAAPEWAAQVGVVRGAWTADTRQWWSQGSERRVQLNLQSAEGDNRWGSGVPVSQLEGLPPAALDGVAANVTFAWTREAGVVHFEGSFDGGRGTGTYLFEPNANYLETMGSLGYPKLSSDELLRLAVLDVTTAFTRGIRAAGYTTLSLDSLRRFRIHRVTPEFIQGLEQRKYRGLLAEDLIRMRIHNVTLAEIDALAAAGYAGLNSDELIKMRIHKVTPEFIRSIHDVGYRDLTIDQLVRMRIHKVDAQFIKDLQADGYKNHSISDVITLAIRGPPRDRHRRRN